MSKEIIIAIISGIAGLTSVLIAWVQAIRTSRIKADTDSALEKIRSETSLALEQVKADQERKKRAFEIAIEESRPIEVALAQAWHDIQSIKDVIAKYISGFRFDVSATKNSFHSAYTSLCEGYARWGTEAPDNARHAWHNAKGSANSVEILLNETTDNDLPLPSDLTERMKEIRTALTDSQMVIAAGRHAVRDTVMKKVLELV
jgi:hypothetical protein